MVSVNAGFALGAMVAVLLAPSAASAKPVDGDKLAAVQFSGNTYRFCDIRDKAPISTACLSFVIGVVQEASVQKARASEAWACFPRGITTKDLIARIRPQLRLYYEEHPVCSGWCPGASAVVASMDAAFPCNAAQTNHNLGNDGG